MLRDRLEIVVFTYDRAAALDRTLGAVFDSPFAECAVTVLDNHSSDSTPSVCAAWRDRFEDLRVIRHPRNIGLGANYLRGVEVSRGEYTWLLSDDEDLDLSDSRDVLDVIERGDADIIGLGAPGQQAWERGLHTTTCELRARGGRFFLVYTFAAGVIFRTRDFDDDCVWMGYRDLANLYPHFEYVYRSLLADRRVYNARRALVRRTQTAREATIGSNLSWLAAWARCARRIEDRDLRRQVVYEVMDGRAHLLWYLAVHIGLERVERPDRVAALLLDLFRTFSWDQRVLLALALPVLLVPSGLLRRYQAVQRRARRLGQVPDLEGFDPKRL